MNYYGGSKQSKGAFAKGGSSFYSNHKGHGGYDSFGSYGHGAHVKGKSYGEKGKASAPPKENYRQLRILPAELADLTVPKDTLQHGEMRSFHRGHLMGAAGELYFEVFGDSFNVQLVIPGSTRLAATDWEDFKVPVKLAGQTFPSIEDLQKRICRIRELYQSQVKEGKSKGRLVPDDEKLMWEVFRHHPYATEKLMGATYIQVGQSPKSNNPNDYAFFIMRNDEDGDDISYVKCLRCLAEAQHGKQNTEQVLSLASISLGKALQLDINGAAMVLADEPQGSVGIRVELEKRFLSLHSVSGIYGPYLLGGDLKTSNSALKILVEAPQKVNISWAGPFQLYKLSRRLGLPPPAKEVSDLKKSLELLMKEAQVPGDLSGFPLEEVRRISYQALVRSLHSATQVQRSRRAAQAQGQGLVILAKNQAQELMQEQLQRTLQDLKTSTDQQEALQNANDKLMEELQFLKRQVEPQAADPGTQKDTSTELHDGPQSYQSTDGTPVQQLQNLNKRLRTALPDHAASMLRNSLKLMSSEMYSGPCRAFWELLQNADDCRYQESPWIKVAYSSKFLWLEYNEVGFSFKDVEALCSLGASTKGLGQTGHKGVGFKASFVLSARPHVLSENYKFFFDEENDCSLPQVTPEVLPSGLTLPRKAPVKGTAMYLPLRRAFPSDLLGELHPSTLLFLRRLKSITVENERETPCHCYTYVLSKSSQDHRIDVVTCKKIKSDGEDLPMKEEEHSFFVARWSKDPEVAIAFPLTGTTPSCAAVSTTLPLTSLPGLKTPLNAPFQLTANREALQDASPKNAALRDTLAELWLSTVKDAKHLGLPQLQLRAWLLLPGNELGQQRFWAPFYQKVFCGLREVPLVPIRESQELLPTSRCRKAESSLLGLLGLGPKDLALVNLGIPTEAYMAQLPEGSSPNFQEFNGKDLLRLLQTGRWEAKGNPWRKAVVKALVKRPQELDFMQLREVPLFILAKAGATKTSPQWSKCGEGHIFAAEPKSAPSGLLKVLDADSSCKEDKELLKMMGCGGKATARDVGYAIVNQSMGVTQAEDERFSWKNLAYIGQHWDTILDSQAADAKLSKLTREEMEDLLRSILVPEGTAGVLHVPRELYTPFVLGRKPITQIERSKLVQEPPSATGVQQRLWWERVFLRLGVQSLCSSGAFTLTLPKGLFAETKACNDLAALLDYYEKLGVLETLRSCSEIEDCADQVRKVVHGGNDRKRLLGPAFQQYLGPDFVVLVCKVAAEQKLAERLLEVIMQPTADLVLKLLHRAAAQGIKTWLLSCRFLAEEWRQQRLSPQLLEEVKTKGQLWVPSDGPEKASAGEKVCWREIEHLLPPWTRKHHRELLKEFFISGLGLAEVAATPPVPSAPEIMETFPDVTESGKASMGSHQSFDEMKDDLMHGGGTTVCVGGVVLASRTGSASADGVAHGFAHSRGPKRPLDASTNLVDLRPHKVKRESEEPLPLAPLPQLRERMDDNPFESADGGALPTLNPGEPSFNNPGFASQFPPLPVVAKLLVEVYHANGGDEFLHGSKVPEYSDLSIAEIRFSQTSVSATFRHGALKGRRLLDVASDVRNGKLSASQLPLSVVMHGQQYWTLNNRSLYVLNKASRQREPLVARVAVFQLCPVTAKFLQLRCGSLLEEPNEPEDESEGEAQEPEFDVKDEEMLERGSNLDNLKQSGLAAEVH